MPRLCPPGKFRRALDQLEEDFEGGLEALESLAKTYAKDPDVRSALGMAYMDDDRSYEALPHLEWAERKDPSPVLQESLLATYLALDMPQHALKLAARSPRFSRDQSVEDAQAQEDAAAENGLSVQDRLAFERARTGLLHGDGRAAATLKRLLAKHPDYQPARNLLVTNTLLQGDIEGFADAANDAFAHAPDDPHALLNAARAAYFRGGVDAARSLRPQADALVPDDGWGGDRYLARAGAFALMDDADAMESALAAYHDWVQATGDVGQPELADAIDDLLERRQHDPRAPLVDLHELIVGIVGRWKSASTERVVESIQASLTSMPGLLRELPNTIGYQAPAPLRLLVMLLLHDLAPPPPRGSWVGVFEQVARHGPGTRAARRALLLLLAETGHIDEDEVVELEDADEDGLDAGDDAGDEVGRRVQVRRLEISGEAVPSGLPAVDEARMTAALEDLQAGRIAQALEALSALHERYPDSLPLAYNRALAERLSGGDATRRGRERLQRLVDQHPEYLFARADLARAAIDEGDLAKAEALLALPEGKRRFHTSEWAAFASASGSLALTRGDLDAAEQFLDGIGEVLGSETGPYLALESDIDRFLREHDPDLSALDMLDDALDDALDDEGEDEGDDGDDADDDDGLDEDDGPHDGEYDDGENDAFDDDEDVELAAVPDVGELAAMPMLEERWCIALRPAVFMFGEDPEPTLTWLGAVATDDGFVRLANVELEVFDPERLLALLAQACAGGMVAAEPGRPRIVRLEDAELAAELAERTAALGIEVMQGDIGPAMTALHGLAEALGGVPSWLADAEGEHVEAFLDAVDAFYDATPWHRFCSDQYVAFRVGDGPWRYAHVMGEAGEEFGLAVFAGWREAHAFGQDTREGPDAVAARLEAIGALEGLSLNPFAALSPLDAGRYLVAEVGPDAEGVVPAWVRLEPDGPALPEQGPGVYAVLIALLAEHAQRTRHQVRRIDTTADTPAGPLRVLYPATGAEPGHEPTTPT